MSSSNQEFNTSITTNSKLEIYYVIDIGSNIDINCISICLKAFLVSNFRNRDIVLFKRIDSNYNPSDDEDIIKQGLITFNSMFHNLKLKTTNEVWFFYIGYGNIQNHKDVSLILLNKNPGDKECYYVVNKQQFDIKNTDNKNTKINKSKLVYNSLKQIIETNHMIKYSKIV